MIRRSTLLAGLTILGASLAAPSWAQDHHHSGDHHSAHQAVVASQAVVQALYAGFAAGDIPTVVGLFADDIVWMEGEGGPLADRNPYVGADSIVDGVFMRIVSQWTGFQVTPEVFLPSGDRVVVLGRYTGVNNATGEPLDAQFAHVFTVVDGRVTAFQQYTDTAQWRDNITPD